MTEELPDWKKLSETEKRTILRELLEVQHLTGGQAATRFVNASRSALIAFARRRGIKMNKPEHQPEAEVKPEPKEVRPRGRPKKVKPEPKIIIEEDDRKPPARIAWPPVAEIAGTTPPDPAMRLSFFDAITSDDRCKWPLWEDWRGAHASMCCGMVRPKDKPYCDFHEAMSQGKGTKSERDAVKVLRRMAKAG